MKTLKFYSAILLINLLSGCGTTGSVNSNFTKVTNNNIYLEDLRRPEQKLSRTVVLNDVKEIYFGDDNLKPTSSELLKNALYEKLGSKLNDKKISLTDFIINVNEPISKVDSGDVQTAAAGVPNGYAAAPLAELFINLIENTRSEKIVNVQVTGKVNDKVFSSTSSEKFKGRVTESNINQVINTTLANVIKQIDSNLNVE